MSGVDAAFLYFETPTNHINIHAVMIVDPSTMPGGYSFDVFKEFVGSRLPRLREFRQRIARVPFDLNAPVWFDAPGFDIDYHVRRTAVPSPGGPTELAEVVADIASRPLDRTRPLWEMWIAEGLAEGRVAVIAKLHHATVDGVSGSNMATQILDLEPTPSAPDETDDWEPERRPSDLEMFGHALLSRLRRPPILEATRIVPTVVRSLASVVQLRRRKDTPAGGTPLTAPRLAFNAPLTPHRKVAFASVSLDEVKHIKNTFGCTVNDVVLATAAGALRTYLENRAELPEKPLLATCPVSVQSEKKSGNPSANNVSAMFVSLPTHLDHPVERLATIRASTRGAKEEHKALGATTIMELTEMVSPNVFGAAARAYTRLGLARRHPPAANLIVSNVPGPPVPLYLAGAKVESLLPLGLPLEGLGLNLTVFSYVDHIDWGFIACRELVPDLDDLAAAVGDAHAELLKAAEQIGTAATDRAGANTASAGSSRARTPAATGPSGGRRSRDGANSSAKRPSRATASPPR